MLSPKTQQGRFRSLKVGKCPDWWYVGEEVEMFSHRGRRMVNRSHQPKTMTNRTFTATNKTQRLSWRQCSAQSLIPMYKSTLSSVSWKVCRQNSVHGLQTENTQWFHAAMGSHNKQTHCWWSSCNFANFVSLKNTCKRNINSVITTAEWDVLNLASVYCS